MMSAITPMLSSSTTNQASIKPVPPANPPSSPIGIATLPKISATSSSPATSPSKPNVSVNHTSVPLSLVHENKSNEIQTPPSAAKTPEKADKPKDLSPTKPTPNGVEEPSPKPKEEVKPSAPASQTKPNENSSEATAPVPAPTPEKSEASEKAAPAAPTPAESAPPPAPAPAPAPASAAIPAPVTSPEAPSEKKETVPENETETAGKPSQTQNSATTSKKNKEEGKQAAEAQPAPKRKRQKPSEPEVAEEQPKTKRIRSQVIHFQSPLPELNTIINRSLKVPKEANKSTDDKLIVFYKNEFLAVRNAEGGFYICQAQQNVYRTSHRIKIKWLSKEGTTGSNPDGDIYIPDFHDNTDFECILTTVALEKMEKNKYKLPKVELERTESILKRALDVEKGVEKPPEVTEEHPDGLDLSLFKDESQLQTKSKTTPKRKKISDTEESPKAKQPKTTTRAETKKTKKSKKKSPKKKLPKSDKTVKKPVGKPEKAVSKEVEQLKGSPPNDKARVVAKVLRKVETTTVKETTSKKSTKHKVGKGSKSNPVKKETKKPDKIIPVATTSKSSDRRAVTATSRKKGGRK